MVAHVQVFCDARSPACGVILLGCFRLCRFVVAFVVFVAFVAFVVFLVQEEIIKLFPLFDEDGTGGETFQKNLKRAAREVGETLNDEGLQVKG